MKQTRMIPLAAALLGSAFLSAAEPEFPKCENINAIIGKLRQNGADALVKLERQQNTWIATDTNNKRFSIRCVPVQANNAAKKFKGKTTNRLPLLQMAAIVKQKTKGKIESIEFKNNQYAVVLKEDGVQIDQYYSPDGKLKSWVIVD